MPNWPVGTKSKGNEGVTASLKTTPGSIGYVEYGYAKSQKLTFAALENKSGKLRGRHHSLRPGGAGLDRTAGQPDRLGLATRTGADAYPIVTYTWIICYRQYPDAKKLAALQDLLKYCLNRGSEGRRVSRLHSAAGKHRHQGSGRGSDHHPVGRGNGHPKSAWLPELAAPGVFTSRPGEITQAPSSVQQSDGPALPLV